MKYAFKKALNFLAISSLILAGIAAVPSPAAAASLTRVETREVLGGQATVAWATDVPTTGVVRFGTDAANLTNFVGDSQLRTDHEARLIGLQPRTRYYYTVTSREASGAEVTSFVFNFTTLSRLTDAEENERDANRQQASSTNDRIGVDAAATAAAVSWTSGVQTRGFVRYGELNQRTRTSSRTSLGTIHQVLLTRLKPSTVYEYTVTMLDEDGDTWSVRGPFRFTTAERQDQENTALTITYLGPSTAGDARLSPTSARVEYRTNHLAAVTVTYRATTRGVSSRGTVKLGYGYQQYAPLNDLKPDTDYEVTISARDAWGKRAELKAQKFHTPSLTRAAATSPRVAGATSQPSGRVVKSPESSTVYYVYPGSGKKKPYANQAAFFSYGHTFAEVELITPQQLSAITDVQLVKSTTSPTVYKLEGATLRPIVSEAAFLAAGYRWSDVELANPTDVQSYPLGTPIS